MNTSQPTLYPVDETHDAGLQSWVESANSADADFPIQNLPFGRFRTSGGDWRLGVAVGDSVLDLRAAGLVDHADMNRLMSAPLAERRALRKAISEGLSRGSERQASWQQALVAQSDAEMGVPCLVVGLSEVVFDHRSRLSEFGMR
jgi:fumarylacetoacetase